MKREKDKAQTNDYPSPAINTSAAKQKLLKPTQAPLSEEPDEDQTSDPPLQPLKGWPDITWP